MAIHPDLPGGCDSRLRGTALALMLLVLPSAIAEEPLDEEFLMFLSDWSDDTGEFIAPSDVEDTWTEDVLPQPAVETETDAQSEEGEQDD
ncbi:hypothetical protein JF535_09415 [Microbulbifer salipaludis]|uniref:Secreted protein n=1 Tax=Microbulbifer salipaludis TaxID=187980 RepID=A0ABS3E6Y4_9GAMM|nr:hypothetical protein [Microbulbifer salipaludis]MBN8431066.1 hypothetical protein [Microbulbifer salipaludis]